METIEIAGLYVVMAAAILAGVLLLWYMIVELVRFDPEEYRPRSARVPAPMRRAELHAVESVSVHHSRYTLHGRVMRAASR
jgi:hypothetical protein